MRHDRGFSVLWSNPGDSSIVTCEFRLRGPRDNQWRPWRNMAGADSETTSHRFRGLTNGVTYRVQVRAVGLNGRGPASEVSIRAGGNR